MIPYFGEGECALENNWFTDIHLDLERAMFIHDAVVDGGKVDNSASSELKVPCSSSTSQKEREEKSFRLLSESLLFVEVL